MKRQHKSFIGIALLLISIITLSVIFLFGDDNVSSSQKLFSVEGKVFDKEDILWELHKKDHSNTINMKIREEIFLVNTDINEEIKEKVEKSMLLSYGFQTKEEFIKNQNSTVEEFERKLNVQTAIVQQLINEANLTNEEIEMSSSSNNMNLIFNVFKVENVEVVGKVKDYLNQGIELERAAQKADEEYHLSYRWYITYDDLMYEEILNYEEMGILFSLSPKETKIFDTEEGAVFVEMVESMSIETESLYIDSIYQLSSERGVNEEGVFQKLKEKTNIEYYDEKYFE